MILNWIEIDGENMYFGYTSLDKFDIKISDSIWERAFNEELEKRKEDDNTSLIIEGNILETYESFKLYEQKLSRQLVDHIKKFGKKLNMNINCISVDIRKRKITVVSSTPFFEDSIRKLERVNVIYVNERRENKFKWVTEFKLDV